MEFTYRCMDCRTRYPGDTIRYLCPACASKTPSGEFISGLLEVENTLPDPHEARSFSSFSPYPLPDTRAFPAGNTPLVKPLELSSRYGLSRLFFKLDSLNPSGSFKDRASLMVAAQALHHGEQAVVLASTGNAGSAMACAGAAFGLQVVLFVPESAPANKLMQSVLYGAQVVPIEGTYDEAFRLSIEWTQAFGGVNRNTAYNPMTVEGKKSVSIELWEQFGSRIPDVVYIPVGDGVIFSGVYKGFRDLVDAGLTDRLPALVCVQSELSDAISRAWKTGAPLALSEASTLADSISVASPAGGRYALRGLIDSGGWATVVSDTAILDAQRELSRDAGIFAEPAAAAAWAGLRQDRQRLADTFGDDARIAVLITGTGFKDMGVFSSVTMPKAIPPTLEAAEERLQK